MMLSKKTVKRLMKRFVSTQLSNSAVDTLQKGIEDFILSVCEGSKRFLKDNNYLRELQRLPARKRITEVEVSEAIRRIIRTESDIGIRLHPSEVETQEVAE